ncbi:cation-translocating P-type ATPase [Enterococcus hirae]|uniref:P-type ATPase A domain-containing protein n=3 Tax=Enterococcus hirae TaxID=1354 RepID=A0AB37I9T5_ENTHR|nr:cation-translocating P-type ATPase [Enterococcus hirae]EMF0150862.1 cation-translocating P-type ATPase [Enterococcus hirae]EMF0243668.1 cation-translocating P-type ATPase [Enterococcus hirae]EMF0384762.1 cation-translocating P-type ATPase [Enterococcus hirae]EMF0435967.1 cation-translocating P-type ATPase [Enterococcus hirae]EMF0486184.1 cation-translocating P-type ATPase [Enterococcus hirae]
MRIFSHQTEVEKDQTSVKNITRYAPDYREGLTDEQVAERVHAQATNETIDPSFKTNKQIVLQNIFTYFNLIFIVLAVLLCLVSSYKNLTFLPVILANTGIAIYQEIRSKKILDNLSVLNAAKVTVVRNGVANKIDMEELVLDDVILLETGQQIPADGYVLDGKLQVNEALLTGEADEIVKEVDDYLMSGSFVVSGKAYVRLDKVGYDSYISQLTAKAKKMGGGEQSEMIASLNKLIKWIGIIIIPIGITLFSQSYFFNGNTIKESVVAMEAALIGMIPEGLYLLTTIALAMSAARLAKQRVLLHDMKSIETLARVNILCVDKTGTITEDQMSVQKLVIAKNEQAEQQATRIQELISDYAKAMANDNATMQAIKTYFNKPTDQEPLSILPFSSVQKFSSVTFADGVYVLGAPEMVLRERFETVKNEFSQYADQGYRVLVFGSYQGKLSEALLEAEVIPLAYLLIANPIRKEAPDTFAYFKEQGVAIKVISGDNPQTVSTVALQAGIANADQYIDVSQLAEEDYLSAVEKYTVFGRVKPEQKMQFVQLLKQKNTVAMTGDGVNDILAMKEADCSIAMASGNEATIQAAQVALLDSDFSRMPEIVAEGRRVVNNIERSASLFLVKNIFSFLLSVFSVLFALTYPLEPSQITLISLFTIGLPSFLLALEENKNRIEGKFIVNVLEKAIPGGLTDMTVVGTLVVGGVILHLNKTDVSTASTMLLTAVGFLVLYKICHPLNQFRGRIILFCAAGILFSVVFLHKLFSISAISPVSILLLLILFFAADSIFRQYTRMIENYSQLKDGKKKRSAWFWLKVLFSVDNKHD